MSILAKVTSTRDREHAYFNLLVYGAPGTGKTYLARTAVEAGHRVLLLDADQGTMTLRDADVQTLPIHRFEDIMEVFEELSAGGHGFDTVFIDNLSELQKLLVDRLKIEHGKKFGRHSWGLVLDRTSMLCRQFRTLPMNLVVLAHSMEIADDDRVRVRPALSGKKLPHEIGGLFDLVGYAHTGRGAEGEVNYRIGFATVGDRHITKDRSGRLEAIEPNDFGLLYRKVFGHGPVSAADARDGGAASRPLGAGGAGDARGLGEDARLGDDQGERRREAEPRSARVQKEVAPSNVTPFNQRGKLNTIEPVGLVEPSEPAERTTEREGGTGASSPIALAARAPEPVVAVAPSVPTGPAANETPEPFADLPLPEGAHGTATWTKASRHFQAVLMKVCEGDRTRVDFICDIIKQREGVETSTALHAERLEHWAVRLEEAAGKGDLQRYFDKRAPTGDSTLLRLHQNIIKLHGALSKAGMQAQATSVIKKASHGKALYELDQYVLAGILGELRKMKAS